MHRRRGEGGGVLFGEFARGQVKGERRSARGLVSMYVGSCVLGLKREKGDGVRK